MKLYRHEQIGISAILIIIFCFLITYKNLEANYCTPFILPNQFDQDSLITAISAKPETPYSKKFQKSYSKQNIQIDLNKADSLMLISIKGIGSYTANKILRYRKKLGGFYSPKQLLDLTWKNIPMDSLLFHFTASPNGITKQDMNSLTFKEILRHPYLEYEDVCEICNAKRKYGAINIDTLHKYQIVPPHKMKKIKYYFK